MLNENLFISAQAHPKDVAMPDGSTNTFHFREVPNTVLHRYYISQAGADDGQKAKAAVEVVVASLCTDDGEPVLEFEKAARLKSPVLSAFFKAAMEVNTTGQGKG